MKGFSILLIVSLTIILLSFYSCAPFVYVAPHPAYVQQAPPPQQYIPPQPPSPPPGATYAAAPQPDYNSPSFQTFYDALSPYGTWVQNPNYGYVWL